MVPNPDKRLAFPVHAELITKNGIFNHENLFFDELIAAKKYQFVYIFSPAPMVAITCVPRRSASRPGARGRDSPPSPPTSTRACSSAPATCRH